MEHRIGFISWFDWNGKKHYGIWETGVKKAGVKKK